MDNYIIEHADKKKAYFRVKYKSDNAETSVVLPGKYSVDYGQDLNSTLFHLMEHFPDKDAPLGQQHGQLWYDTNTNKLKVLTNELWQPLGYTRPPVIPKDALLGTDVDNVPADYLSIDGGEMRGPLVLKEPTDADSENCAVTKNYVDLLIPPIPSDYIPLKGNSSPAGPIIMKGPAGTEQFSAVTRQYVDDTIPQMHTIFRDAPLMSQGTLKGYYNCVLETPSNMCYIFGVIYLLASNSVTNVSLTFPGNKKYTNGVAITCNFVGPHEITEAASEANKIYCDVDAYYDPSVNPQMIRFQKHNIERDGSIHFTMIGRIA